MSMALNVALALDVQDVSQSSYTLTSYTPTANSLQVAMLMTRSISGTPGTFGEASLKWTMRASANMSSNRYLELWTANVDGSPGSIAPIRAGLTGCSGFTATVWEVTGHDTANPVRQLYSANQIAGANPSIVFPSALLTGNVYIIGAGCARNPPTSTSPTSWTETADGGLAGAFPQGVTNAYRVNGETTTTFAFTSLTQTWAKLGIEINADPGATAYPRRGVVGG